MCVIAEQEKVCSRRNSLLDWFHCLTVGVKADNEEQNPDVFLRVSSSGRYFFKEEGRGRFNTKVNSGEEFALLTGPCVSQHLEELVFVSLIPELALFSCRSQNWQKFNSSKKYSRCGKSPIHRQQVVNISKRRTGVKLFFFTWRNASSEIDSADTQGRLIQSEMDRLKLLLPVRDQNYFFFFLSLKVFSTTSL